LPEAFRNGLGVDSVAGRYIGERRPGGVQRCCLPEGRLAPGGSLAVTWDLVLVEVGGDGGAVDAVAGGEFVDRCAGSIRGDEVVTSPGERRRWLGFESRPFRFTRFDFDNVSGGPLVTSI
jgi:hypothetical protein